MKAEYDQRCRDRWGGLALRDALSNWVDFETLKADLARALSTWRRNPWQEDFAGKCHNPTGALSSFLWNLQLAWQPDRSRLDPLLDFEDHFQKVFLRRGLVIYCQLLLEAMEREQVDDPGQLLLLEVPK